jgi:hypothetical protein
MRLLYAIAAVTLLGTTATAQTAPIDVSYTVSGTTGNWIYDFSVTNNLPNNDVYAFGVSLSNANSVGKPVGWDNGLSGFNLFNYGGSNTNYSNTWVTCPNASCPVDHPLVNITSGQTLNGFRVSDAGLSAVLGVNWYVTTIGTHLPYYQGDKCSFNCNAPYDNSGFEGRALSVPSPTGGPATSTVPEPQTVWLLSTGFLVLAGLSRQNRRRR